MVVGSGDVGGRGMSACQPYCEAVCAGEGRGGSGVRGTGQEASRASCVCGAKTPRLSSSKLKYKISLKYVLSLSCHFTQRTPRCFPCLTRPGSW